MDTRQDDLLTLSEVLLLLSISRSALYRLMAADFPLPLQISSQSNRWCRSEIDAWLEQKPRAQIQVREPASPSRLRAGSKHGPVPRPQVRIEEP